MSRKALNINLLDSNDPVRLDIWLWAARFYKTRRLAVDAIKAGRVGVNDAHAKPARMIHRNDRLTIKKGPYVMEIEVLALCNTRHSASIAQQMYAETDASIARREKLSTELKTAARQIMFDQQKPNQRARALSRRAKRGE